MSVDDETTALRERVTRLEAELRHAREALEASDRGGSERFRAVIDALPDGAFVVDGRGNVELSNARAAEIFGVPFAEFTSIAPFVPAFARPDHADQVASFVGQSTYSRSMAGGRTVAFERPNGERRHIEIALAPIRVAGHRRVFVRVSDVTERIVREQEQRQLAAIVENSDDAIIGLDLDGRVTSWNAGAERLYGHARAEMIGVRVNTLSPARLIDESTHALERVRHEGAHLRFETVRVRKGGTELDVSVSLSPVRDASGRIVGAAKIDRDITESKKRDSNLRRSNAELEQFAYVASHDLQEPLRMVANYTELLAERYKGKLDEKADRYIHHASDGARRMQQLVNDLLAFSRVDSEGKPLVAVDANAVLERVVRVLKSRITEAGGEVAWASLPSVLADEGQLGQLFQNLISNAVKFRSDRPPKVTIEAVRDGSSWRFSVADNGIGFDMKFAERVFQMFQRLHDRALYAGSGIGLAIAKRVVERHGGRIWVESTQGLGTTFFFTLPATRES